MLPIDQVAIETPEQIDLLLEPAGLGSRFVAWIVDILIKGLFLFGLFLTVLILAVLAGASLDAWLRGYSLALILLLVSLFLMGYDVYFEVRHNGQTPGKKHQAIRVLRESGGPVDFRSACIRSLLAPVDFIATAYLLGASLVLLTRRRQRLGDLAAGTMVIRERAAAPVLHEPLVEHFASEDYIFTAQHLSACDANDRQVLRSFFQRYRELTPEARSSLAGRLAGLFLVKTGFPLTEPIVYGPEAVCFLASLQRDLDNWFRQGR
jgi:uncharacterized RDD family membrane protein YckC